MLLYVLLTWVLKVGGWAVVPLGGDEEGEEGDEEGGEVEMHSDLCEGLERRADAGQYETTETE